MFRKLVITAISWLLLSVVVVEPAHAQVVINEVLPDPTAGPEWLELVNLSPTTAVDLSGWSLFDQLSTPSLLLTLTNITLAPQTYLVVELTSQKLNNGGDGVILQDAAGQMIDQMSYPSSQPGQSWSRQPDSTGSFTLSSPTSNQVNLVASPIPTPSPTPASSPSPSPSPQPSPDYQSWQSMIEIANLLPCPLTDHPEWVELYNTDAQEHELTAWFFQDESEQTRSVNLTLPGKSQTRISWNSSWLNNTGDTLTLYSPNGTLIDQLGYTECEKGIAIGKNGQNITASPATTVTESITTATPDATPNSAAAASTARPPPPSPPAPLYPATQIKLAITGSQLSPTASTTTQSITNLIGSTIPLTAITSVILGGLLLVGVGSYFLYGLSQTDLSLS